ncbi:hypothetical protein SDJN03_03906, partial [Cucurbita argyrosperma subsp. sororia]
MHGTSCLASVDSKAMRPLSEWTVGIVNELGQNQVLNIPRSNSLVNLRMAPLCSAHACQQLIDDPDELTDEEISRYAQAVLQSDGFDVPSLRDNSEFGLIQPVCEKYLSKPYIQDCAEKAINEYNIKNGTNFEFVEVVRANHQASMGILYYITFDVKQIITEIPTTFEAKVLHAIDDSKERDQWMRLFKPMLDRGQLLYWGKKKFYNIT